MGKKTATHRKKAKTQEKLKKDFSRKLPTEVKNVWNRKKTFTQNIQDLGISYKLNQEVRGINKPPKEKKEEKQKDDSEDIFEDSIEECKEEVQPDFLSLVTLPSEKDHVKTKKILQSDEVEILNKLKAKYKENYQKMKWDMKLNPYQWNKKQLIKRFETLNNSTQ